MDFILDWPVIGTVLTNLIHYVGEAVTIIIATIQISFP